MVVISMRNGEQEVFDVNHLWIEEHIYNKWENGEKVRHWFPWPHWETKVSKTIYPVYCIYASLTGSGKQVVIGKFKHKETATDHMLKMSDIMASGKPDPYNNPYRIMSTHF